MKYVPGEGNPNAQLMVVGEAPGYYEELEGGPFRGPSGKIINDCLEKGGCSRDLVYLTNVVKIRPPDNEIHRLVELGTKVEDFLPQLWKEIEEINPNCILAFGNTALKALTGNTGIQKYRGSILPNNHSALPKVVSTIHPASIMHQSGGENEMSSYRDLAFIQFDVNRAVQQSLFRDLRTPQRNLHYAKSSLDLIRFFDRNKGKRDLAYDIETIKAIPMCISFAFSRHEAISIPLFNILDHKNPEGIPKSDMVFIWKTVADLLRDPQFRLIGHNLKFDHGRLAEIGLTPNWPYFDTNLAFHIMYSELPKKLQFVSSILTEEPYYKDDLEEYNPKKDKLVKRLIYNARDSAVTFEVYEREVEELTEMGMLDWFFENQMTLFKPYYNMESRGILVDKKVRKFLEHKYERYIRWIDKSLTRDLGYELNVNSWKQVATTLYSDLKCPVRKGTDEETLQGLMLNAVKDEKRVRIINNVLKGRKARKTKSTYISAKLFPDDRHRTIVNICGTESGRTSTSKPKSPVVAEPMGVAFQTLTKHGDVGADLRKMYVPDPGWCFIEGDGGQAEARVVSILAKDYKALEMMDRKDFKRNKFGIKDDLHTYTTEYVTGIAFEAITDDIRQLGKKTRHAGNYGMGKGRLSMMAQISQWKAGKCLERFHEENPNIKSVFWEEIKQALQDNGNKLVSPHGRPRMFFEKWGEDMFKEAYSFIPQATVSDHTKFAMLRVEARAPWINVVQESHDSFLSLVPIGREVEAGRIIKEEYEVPIDFSKCSLSRGQIVIPAEIKVGYTNWKDMKDLKLG